MFGFILIIFFLISVLFALIAGAAIFYHFKRFGLMSDPNVKKILNIFTVGGLIIIFFSGILLVLLFF